MNDLGFILLNGSVTQLLHYVHECLQEHECMRAQFAVTLTYTHAQSVARYSRLICHCHCDSTFFKL